MLAAASGSMAFFRGWPPDPFRCKNKELSVKNIAFLSSVTILLFFGLTEPLLASPYPKTKSDFAVLPGYCSVRFGNKSSAEYKKWKNIFGYKGWTNMHHYCKGLLDLHKGKSATKGSRQEKSSYQEAINGFNYVKKYWPSNFKLNPELHVKKGAALIGLGKYSQALGEFQSAIRIKPNYSAPYLALSEYYLGVGNKEQAASWLQEGIKKVPKSKRLKRKLMELEKMTN